MRFLVSKRVYYILAIILFLAFALEFTRAEFILYWNSGREDTLPDTEQGKGKKNALDPEKIEQMSNEKWTIVYHPGNDTSERLKEQAYRVLDGLKLRPETAEAAAYVPPISGEGGVLLALTDLSSLSNIERIMEYGERGGSIFFLGIPTMNDEFYSIYRKLGIIEIGEMTNTRRIRLVSDILINGNGDEFSGEGLMNQGRTLRLDAKSRVLVEMGEGTPMIWERDLGAGRLLVFNGTMLQDKNSRGLIAGGVALLKGDWIYPIIGARLMYIDSFPGPIPSGRIEALYQAYGRNTAKFIRDVWWPDMIRAASRYNLEYTASLIRSYDTSSWEPVKRSATEDEFNHFVMYGREILKNDGELAVNGYHSGPLTSASHKNMSSSIRAVHADITRAFPWYSAVSYAPPSNILSESGRAALKEAWPQLSNISSIYSGDPTRHYLQEFEVAPDGVVEMPRVTSGYQDKGESRWAAANAANTYGIFSHYVYPNDIWDHANEPGRDWESVKLDFGRFLQFVYDRYRYLPALTASEASSKLRDWAESEVYTETSGNELRVFINGFSGENAFILRTDKKIARLADCESERIGEHAYLIRAKKESFTIQLGGKL